MLDRIQQRHEVEGVGEEGQLVAAPLHDGQAALLCHRQRARVVVDAEDLPVLGQVVRHVAGAAADIEDLAYLPRHGRPDLGVEVLQNGPGAPGEPGMLIFFEHGQNRCSHKFPIDRG